MTLLGILVILLLVLLVIWLFRESLTMTNRQIMLTALCLIVLILIVLMFTDNPMAFRR